MKKFNCNWLIAAFVSSLILISCSSTKNESMNKNESSVGIASPPAIVYKTKANYFDKVPVLLSADKTKVISFPAPSDVRRNNKYVYPTKLNSGYLLDNRGIGINTAFLKLSYEDYYTMDNIPNADRLINYILDADPFTEFYEVGKRGDFTNPEKEINEMIDSGKLKKLANRATKN